MLSMQQQFKKEKTHPSPFSKRAHQEVQPGFISHKRLLFLRTVWWVCTALSDKRRSGPASPKELAVSILTHVPVLVFGKALAGNCKRELGRSVDGVPLCRLSERAIVFPAFGSLSELGKPGA